MRHFISDHGRRSGSADTGATVGVNAPPPELPQATAAAPVPGRRSNARMIRALDPLQADEALARYRR